MLTSEKAAGMQTPGSKASYSSSKQPPSSAYTAWLPLLDMQAPSPCTRTMSESCSNARTWEEGSA
eukprot:1140685-Pelagomonas_calceolata.AAC.6